MPFSLFFLNADIFGTRKETEEWPMSVFFLHFHVTNKDKLFSGCQMAAQGDLLAMQGFLTKRASHLSAIEGNSS